MGKRVQQADGTYCYTENCRIHDRGDSNLTGAAAVIADNNRNTYGVLANRISDTILYVIPEFSKKQANNIGNKLVDDIYNTGDTGPAQIGYKIAELIEGEGTALTPTQMEKYYEIGHMVSSELFKKLVIQQGDQVIIKETGERGYVMEGSTFGNGRVRVDTQSLSGKNYSFYTADEVAKIQPNTSGLAREQIVSTSPDMLIHKETVYKLLDQETSVDTRNPQGLNGLSNEDALLVREEVIEAATRFQKGYDHDTLTKGRIIRFVREEAAKNRTWLDEDDRETVRAGFTRILNYIDPKVA